MNQMKVMTAMTASEKLKQLQQKVIKTIENLEASEFFEKIPDVIRDRTRNGFGITKENGTITQLPGLKESTISRRVTMDKQGRLSPHTAPFFSNVTAEGVMLDSLIFKKVNKKYVIGFDNRRKRNGKSPEFIKDKLEGIGFKFFGLAKSERAELEKNVAKKMEKEIAKIFK